MMEGFLNFAHTRYASIGAMVSFYLTRFMNFDPYETWPFAAIFGGFIAVVLYIFIVRPIRSRGRDKGITLTLTFLVLSFIIPSMLRIFNYWSRFWGDIPTDGYDLSRFDFTYSGIDGIVIMGPLTCLLLIIVLHYFLEKTKMGISLRAASENEDLARVMGINPFRAHCITWFISGFLSALAGSIIAIHHGMMIRSNDELIISIMSGALFGGLNNIYGSIFGGFFIALAQDFLKNFLYVFLGLPALKWQALLPTIFLVTIMVLFPEGITGEKSDILKKITTRIRKN